MFWQILLNLQGTKQIVIYLIKMIKLLSITDRKGTVYHIMFMGFSRQEYWSGLSFPSPVDHILSELSTMTHPSWLALHGMA